MATTEFGSSFVDASLAVAGRIFKEGITEPVFPASELKPNIPLHLRSHLVSSRTLPPLTERQLAVLSENFRADTISYVQYHTALWGRFPDSRYGPDYPVLRFGPDDQLQRITDRTRRPWRTLFTPEPVYEPVSLTPTKV